MRVLVVTNMYPTPSEPWFGCFVRDQVEDVAARGVDVRVLQFDGRRDRRAYLRAAAEVRREVARERPDLVHAHYGLTGAVALAQRRSPVVTTFHGSETGYVRWQAYVSWVVARASYPVFVSEEGARLLGRSGATVIPAPVDMELFGPRERAAARRELGWTAEGPYVLFPGARTNRRKRADLFDAAVAEARRELPTLTGVSLEGYARERAALVLAAVDVVLMTSDWEGSPVTVREALACTTPVVSVPVADVPLVLDGLPGCRIAPRDPRALARAVLEALERPGGPELRERASRYSRAAAAERLLGVYEGVAGGPRA